jgi:hypothetical protein
MRRASDLPWRANRSRWPNVATWPNLGTGEACTLSSSVNMEGEGAWMVELPTMAYLSATWTTAIGRSADALVAGAGTHPDGAGRHRTSDARAVTATELHAIAAQLATAIALGRQASSPPAIASTKSTSMYIMMP